MLAWMMLTVVYIETPIAFFAAFDGEPDLN
jgi:hypothetical protein